MLNFANQELEEEVRSALVYVKQYEKQNGLNGLNLEFIDILDENFDPEDYEDLLIDDNYELTICPDYADDVIELTLRDFLDLISESKNAEIIDNLYCISDNQTLIRVEPRDYSELNRVDLLMDSYSDIFDMKFFYSNAKVECSLARGFSLFGLMLHFTHNFDKYFPSISSDDMFLKINYSEQLSREDIDYISESFMFELFATAELKIHKKSIIDYSLDYPDDTEQEVDKIIFRPLIADKGMNDLIKIFNEAENGFVHYDFTILQYTKVIEYVAQTVIRQDVTNRALKKLYTKRALNPDANFVKEIENMFTELKNKYDSDRNSIKETIKTCCDIHEISEFAPTYLDKVVNLKMNLSKERAEKDKIIDAAFDLISDSITDTRNCIAHAKSNYILKGKECPEEYKNDFITMLRVVCSQAIRWFSLVNESSRVVN